MCVCPECSARERMRKQCFLDIVSETVYKHREIQSVQRLIVNSVAVCLQVSSIVPTFSQHVSSFFFRRSSHKQTFNKHVWLSTRMVWIGLDWDNGNVFKDQQVVNDDMKAWVVCVIINIAFLPWSCCSKHRSHHILGHRQNFQKLSSSLLCPLRGF